MKENKYDDERFFQKYSQMLRSQKGLQGAGEWSELQKILPDFNGKQVLDLGCGYGDVYKRQRMLSWSTGATTLAGPDCSAL